MFEYLKPYQFNTQNAYFLGYMNTAVVVKSLKVNVFRFNLLSFVKKIFSKLLMFNQ